MRSKKMQTENKKGKAPQAKSSGAYGDKIPICANTGCALRKKAKCFGFEGCPGFQTK